MQAGGNVVKYEYDLANNPVKITYPNGKAVARAYDNDGRLKSVTDWLEHTTIIKYNEDSEPSVIQYPSTTIGFDQYTYQDNDEPSEMVFKKGLETFASLAYTDNKDDAITKITSKGLPGEAKPEYTYDENDRLTKAGTVSYAYDVANNATTIGNATYSYNAADELENAVSSKKTVDTYEYNEVGERTKTTPSSGPATTYKYDQAGNLIAVERPKEGEVTAIEDAYAYNGEGLRASETIAKSTNYLTWDIATELPSILSNGTYDFIYGPNGMPVEQISTHEGKEQSQYLHHDQQGSTRLITGQAGTVEGKCSYNAYGAPTCEGSATTPLGYDGQYTSPDSGLIYLRAREYDPATAQFLTVDPEHALTRAPFTFAGDDPVNERDRTGLETEVEFCSPFAGCDTIPVKSPSEIGETVVRIAEKNGEEFEGGLHHILTEIKGGGSLPKVGEDGKTHGEIPSYPPPGATTEELEETREDLERSIPIREEQLREKGEDKEHREQLEDERKLLRQIKERLCGS